MTALEREKKLKAANRAERKAYAELEAARKNLAEILENISDEDDALVVRIACIFNRIEDAQKAINLISVWTVDEIFGYWDLPEGSKECVKA